MAGVSAETVKKFVALLEPDFKRFRVESMDAKIRVVELLLQDEEVMDDAIMKYDVMGMMESGDFMQDVIAETSGQKTMLKVHLDSEQQRVLTRNNPDVTITYDGGPVRSHALSYAQRIVDTQRCLKYCSRGGGEIIDFGGNHETHYRAGRIIHCCNFCDSVREMHRQTERLATSTNEDATRDRNFCMAGAQNCDVKARQSISIHAMPDIPWSDWPLIMDRHGCDHHIAVFHYDPVVLTAVQGKLPDSDMIFMRKGKTIEFSFENDPSFSYTHDWENLLKYVTPWVQVSDASPYAYIYDVLCNVGGVVTGEIVRVNKCTLGRQVSIPLHAYQPKERLIEVTTVMDSGDRHTQVTSKNRFVPVTVSIDEDLFQFMMMYGVSNDSADPSMPMDRNTFASMVYTYAHTRKLGGVTVSGMGATPTTSRDVINALWHVVLREHALLTAQSSQLTMQMVQLHRASQLPWTMIMAQIAAAPVVMPANGITEVVSRYTRSFKQWLQNYLSKGITPYAKTRAETYIKLGSTVEGLYNGYIPGVTFAFDRPNPVLELDSEGVSHQQFANALATSIVDTVYASREMTKTRSTTGVVEEIPTQDEVPIPEEDDAKSDSGVDPEDESGTSSFQGFSFSEALTKDRKDLYADDYKQLALDKARLGKQDPNAKMTIVDNLDHMHRNYRAEMREYAMYQMDIGYSKMAKFVINAKMHLPAGEPHTERIRNSNLGLDVGIKCYEMSGGQLPAEACNYAVGVGVVKHPSGQVDYIPGQIIMAADRRSAQFRGPPVTWVYFETAAKIFNEILIADNVLKWLRQGLAFPKVRMELVDGVPGCGKTTEIVQNFDPESTFIMCAGRHSRDDTLLRLQNDSRFTYIADALGDRVRTADSVCRNGVRPIHVKVLEIDEGLMLFPGQIKYAIAQIKPEIVRVFGDSMQITAIDRSPISGELMFKKVIEWSAVEYRNTSHSMPADVTWLLKNQYYDSSRDIRTTSPVIRSLSCTIETSAEARCFKVADVLRDYMSILVADKGKLITTPGFTDGKRLVEQATKASGGTANQPHEARVFTVHEAQGQRLNRVTAVRMNPNSVAVLASKQHIVVCLSRHYVSFKYHTLSNDAIAKLIRVVEGVADSSLRELMLAPSKATIAKIDAIYAQE